jgi:hypothetical protein
MNYKRFLEITQEAWNDYFKVTQEKISRGIIQAELTEGGEAIHLFPNILLITKTKQHYVAELLGASNTFNGLKTKIHKETSIARYLNQFNTNESQPLFGAAKDDNEGNGFADLLVCHDIDFETLKARFPFVNLHPTVIFHHSKAEGALFSLGKNFRDVIFDNCLLVNRYLSSIRVKHILHLTLINKEMLAADYSKWLNEKLNGKNSFPGLHICAPEAGRVLTIAAQFASTYLFYGLRETTIGDFLNQHHEIIQKAVGGKKVIYEPYLKWLEKTPQNTDEAINPDLMIEREDGFYDIYDLKTALLNKTSITKGGRSRRRFIDYVEDGIAQLANYEEYFTFSKNCEYAFSKYGIKVNQPNLILVVGNFDNANKTEIEEASRRLKNITIIDYDSFLQLFLSR